MKPCRLTEGGFTRIDKIVSDQVVDLSQFPGVTRSMRVEIEQLGAIENRVQPEI